MIDSLPERISPDEYLTSLELELRLRQDLGGVVLNNEVESFQAYDEFAQIPDFVPDELLWQHDQEPTRAEILASIPHEGFTPEAAQDLDEQLEALGMPIDFALIQRLPNHEDTKDVVASFSADSANRGVLTIYDYYYELPPEKHIGTLSHESGHKLSPKNPANAELYGGEQERQEAEHLVEAIANQSLLTQTFMNGYHKSLAKQYSEHKISKDYYDEEVHAIAIEYGISNRAKLQQIQDVQLAKMTDLARAGNLPAGVEPVNLMSHPDEHGAIIVDGIDKHLIKLTNGVQDYPSLIEHVAKLKESYYPNTSRKVVLKRSDQSSATVARAANKSQADESAFDIDSLEAAA